MKTNLPRQGRIVGWLKMQGATLGDLADHLGVSVGHASKICNSETAPTPIREKMESYRAPTGERIPVELLPIGKDRKPGPEKGWLDRLKAQATPEPHHVVLGTITVPDGATAVTEDMITDEGRMIGSQDLLVMQFTSALIANETELLGYKQRLSNIENWARTAGYDPANLYTGEGE